MLVAAPRDCPRIGLLRQARPRPLVSSLPLPCARCAKQNPIWKEDDARPITLQAIFTLYRPLSPPCLVPTCHPAPARRRLNVWDLSRIGDEQFEEDAQDGPPELLVCAPAAPL